MKYFSIDSVILNNIGKLLIVGNGTRVTGPACTPAGTWQTFHLGLARTPVPSFLLWGF